MKRIAFAAVLSLSMGGMPAYAHHSFAMFDLDPAHQLVLTGTVKELEWTNPHCWLHMAVVNKKGVPEDWSFEMGSPGQLSGKGWSKTVVKPGDVVTITAHPMKDGSHGGNEITVKLANGTLLGGQPTTGR